MPPYEILHTLADDEIVERLTQVRGIGRWTVEMLLMFRLGRPDILPIDEDPSLARPVEPADEREQRGLARAAWAHHREELTGTH